MTGEDVPQATFLILLKIIKTFKNILLGEMFDMVADNFLLMLMGVPSDHIKCKQIRGVLFYDLSSYSSARLILNVSKYCILKIFHRIVNDFSITFQ